MRYKEDGALALAQAVLGAGVAVKSSVKFEVNLQTRKVIVRHPSTPRHRTPRALMLNLNTEEIGRAHV